jgi:glyoxylase-like metal-dependent hydrolase (beta-lactamase superfamily II)
MSMNKEPKPDWLVDDLGAKGAGFIDITSFAEPPERSYGCLFLPDRLEKGYHVEEIRDGVYWVSVGWYDCMFVVTGNGVVVLDAPPAVGERLLQAIEDVTTEPVTHLIYSHWHADHVGAAAMFDPSVTIVAHEHTRELLARFPDRYRPLPTQTFTTDATLEVGGVKVELSYKGQNHCDGNIFTYLPAQKVLAAIDIASPAWVTFRDCDSSENLSGWEEAHHQVLGYDFDTLISGHVSRLGNHDDVEEGIEYVDDILHYAREALETIPITYFQQGMGEGAYRAAFRAVEENYFAALVNYVTKRVLERKTSNGQQWAERLNGADVLTKHNAFALIEKTRLERTHNGYIKRNGEPTSGKFFI